MVDKGGCKVGKKSDKGGCKEGKKKEEPKPKKKLVLRKKPKVEEKPKMEAKPKKKVFKVRNPGNPIGAKPKLKTVSLRLYGGGMPMKSGFERRGTDVFINREIGRVFSSQKRVNENRPDGNIVKIKMGRGKKAKEGILIGDKIWEKDADYGYDYGNVMRSTKVNYTLKL